MQKPYFVRIAPIFAFTSLIFFYSVFMGYSLGPDILSQTFEGVLSNIPDPETSTFIEMFTAILWNNIIASLLFVVSGIFVGIIPLMFIAFNGFFIGYVSYNVAQYQGIGFVFVTILPHGIIEIPTIILAASMGVGFGYQIIHRLLKKEGLQTYLYETTILFIYRVIPLLILAAAIETGLIYLLI